MKWRSTVRAALLGHLQPKAPIGGIPISSAIQKYHCNKKSVLREIEADNLPAGPGATCILVCPEKCQSLFGERGQRSVIKDAASIVTLAQELRVPEPTLRHWLTWSEHPGLDWERREKLAITPAKAIRQAQASFTRDDGREYFGTVVSRADVESVVAVIRNPCHKRFGGNPGEWIAEGIFRHDATPETASELCYTAAYVMQQPEKFGQYGYSTFQDNLRRLAKLVVRFPTPGANVRGIWTIAVYREGSILRLSTWRNGAVDVHSGEWLLPATVGLIWKDAQGIWYSSRFIKEQTGKSAGNLRTTGILTRFKEAPRSSKLEASKSGTPHLIHHEDEVRPLLGLPVNARSETAADPAGQADSLSTLRDFARSNLKGKQRQVIEALCKGRGELTLQALAEQVGWEIPCDNAFNQTRIKLNAKIKRADWKLERFENKARLNSIVPK
jgi:hypothetical protein